MKDNLNDLAAFVTIARERSFTKAAGKLRVSQSALSHTMRNLEEQLGIRLLQRTTRSVSPTEAGERLLQSISPLIDGIEYEVAALSSFRDKPSGTIRITTGEHAAETILWPKISPFLHEYPDIKIEFSIDLSLVDIVAQRFDAGVRLGEQVEKDMIAVPISKPARMIVVGTPKYFANNEIPLTPKDLINHACINIRLPTSGGIYQWEFEKDGQELRVNVDGQVIFNRITEVMTACLDGFGLAFVPDDIATQYLKNGELIQVLDDWCPPFPGYHLYYPARKNNLPAFSLLVEKLRFSQS